MNVSLKTEERELLVALVDHYLMQLYEAQRASLDPDLPVPELEGIEDKIKSAELTREKMFTG